MFSLLPSSFYKNHSLDFVANFAFFCSMLNFQRLVFSEIKLNLQIVWWHKSKTSSFQWQTAFCEEKTLFLRQNQTGGFKMLWSIIEEFYKKLALNWRKPKKNTFFLLFFEFFSGVGQAFAPEQIAQYLVGLRGFL